MKLGRTVPRYDNGSLVAPLRVDAVTANLVPWRPACKEDSSWHAQRSSKTSRAFERSSKRRSGYPSETAVKRGDRIVHGDKELLEKLGRNDLCPCGSGRRFQALLLAVRKL
jgi:hypothetical protein